MKLKTLLAVIMFMGRKENMEFCMSEVQYLLSQNNEDGNQEISLDGK